MAVLATRTRKLRAGLAFLFAAVVTVACLPVIAQQHPSYQVVAPDIVPQGEVFTIRVVEDTDAGQVPIQPGNQVVINGNVVAAGDGGKVRVPAFVKEIGNQFLLIAIRTGASDTGNAATNAIPQHIEVVRLPPSAGQLSPNLWRVSELAPSGGNVRVDGQGLGSLRNPSLQGTNGTFPLNDSVGSSLQQIYNCPQNLPKGSYHFAAQDASGHTLQAPNATTNPTLTITGTQVRKRGQRGQFVVNSDVEGDVQLLGGEPNIQLDTHTVHVTPTKPGTVKFTAVEVGNYDLHALLQSSDSPAANGPPADAHVGQPQAHFNAGEARTSVTAPITVVNEQGQPLANTAVDVVLTSPQGVQYSRLTTDKNGRTSFLTDLAGQVPADTLALHCFRILGHLWKKEEKPQQPGTGGQEQPPKQPGTTENPTPGTTGPRTGEKGKTPEQPPTVPLTDENIGRVPTTTDLHRKQCSVSSLVTPGPGIQVKVINPQEERSHRKTNDPVQLVVSASDSDILVHRCTCIKDGQKCISEKTLAIADSVDYKWTQGGLAAEGFFKPSPKSGKLLETVGPATIYQPPELEVGQYDGATLTVQITDSRGNDTPQKVRFEIFTGRTLDDYFRVIVITKPKSESQTETPVVTAQCDCQPQPPDWNAQPAIQVGQVDGELKVCAGGRLILHASATDYDTLALSCEGSCGKDSKVQPPMVDESVYAWSATYGSFPDHGVSPVTNSRNTTAIYKAPDEGVNDTVKIAITDSGIQAKDKEAGQEIKIKVYKVEIVDEKTGATLSSPPAVTTEHVAVRTRLLAKVTPDDTGVTYQWEVGGTRIKKYDHRIDDVSLHKPYPLEAKDLQQKNISFFWQKQGNAIPVTVTITVGDFKCTKTVMFNVTKYDDSNREVYSHETGDPEGEDKTPGYHTLPGHHAWHRSKNVDGAAPKDSGSFWGDTKGFGALFNGKAFLLWHYDLISAHQAWRETFFIGEVNPDPPAGALPRPEFFKRDPDKASTDESDFYNYVRLGEFQSLDELGRDVVSPWHNSGHMSIAAAVDGDMGSTQTAPHTKNDSFWRWHGVIDKVRRDWDKDQALVISTSPKNGDTLSAAPTKIVIGFDKKVSMNGTNNTVKLTADKLTINGSKATSLKDIGTSTHFMEYEFSGFKEPADGTVTVVLDGTASYLGRNFTFTIKKP